MDKPSVLNLSKNHDIEHGRCKQDMEFYQFRQDKIEVLLKIVAVISKKNRTFIFVVKLSSDPYEVTDESINEQSIKGKH